MRRDQTAMRRKTVAITAIAATLAVSGCGVTVNSLPLPKPGVSGGTYVLHAKFKNVLNLPDRAKVKVGGSDVGVVTNISTHNYQADVTMEISKDIELPTTATAQLRQATPLGDMFVALTKQPSTAGQAVLHNGDTIGIDQTSAGASVEELLLSLSMLFNGGGIQRLAKITSDLDSIVGGRGPQLAHLLTELTDVIGGLHQNSARIDSVLAQFDSNFATLQKNRAELGAVGDSLPNLLSVLADNNRRIGDLLSKVSVTSAALGDFAHTSREQLVGLADSTNRLMTGIAEVGNHLGDAMDQLHTSYPKILSSMRGDSLATATTVTYLNISVLYDPGSRWINLTDITDFVGSFADVLRTVYGRVTSRPDPRYPFAGPPGALNGLPGQPNTVGSMQGAPR